MFKKPQAKVTVITDVMGTNEILDLIVNHGFEFSHEGNQVSPGKSSEASKYNYWKSVINGITFTLGFKNQS